MEPRQGEPDPRIFFAAERTLLAWIRTGLALMGLGFVVARFDVLEPGALSRAAGTTLIASGIAFIAASAAGYVKTVRRLTAGEPFVGHISRPALALAALLALGGGAVIVYLFAGTGL